MSTRKWMLFCLGAILLVAVLVAMACSGRPESKTTTDAYGLLTAARSDSSHVSGDYDGDAWRDLCYVDRATGKWYVFLAKDSKFDFDGDGICDAYHYDAATGRWAIVYAVPHSVVLLDTTGYSQLIDNTPSGTWGPWGSDK